MKGWDKRWDSRPVWLLGRFPLLRQGARARRAALRTPLEVRCELNVEMDRCRRKRFTRELAATLGALGPSFLLGEMRHRCDAVSRQGSSTATIVAHLRYPEGSAQSRRPRQNHQQCISSAH